MPTILAFQASPDNFSTLRLDEEIREINNCISPNSMYDFLLISVGAVKIHDLPKYLLKETPEIFHFSGHGEKNGNIVLENNDGDSESIAEESIETIFKHLAKGIKCVVLNSCYSSKLGKAISKYVPYVIGNSSKVPDDIAVIFSKSFYESLSNCKSIEASFDIARAIISSKDKKYYKLPTLIKNPKFKSSSNLLYERPVLMAKFQLNKKNKIKSSRIGYDIKIWIENVPKGVYSILYNFNHDSIEEDYVYEEVFNDGSGVDVERELFGNIQIRSTLWYKNSGIGIVSTLYDALDKYYSENTVSHQIKKAIEDIQSN